MSSDKSNNYGLREVDRTLILVDGANIHRTLQALNFRINFNNFRRFFADRCNLVESRYYTAVYQNSEGDRPLQKLIDFLNHHHYNVIEKPAKEFSIGDNRSKIKGNMDIEIAIDAINAVRDGNIQQIILCTGDGDFVPVVKECQRFGCSVTIVSSTQGRSENTSSLSASLQKAGSNFIDLLDIREEVEGSYEFRESRRQSNGG